MISFRNAVKPQQRVVHLGRFMAFKINLTFSGSSLSWQVEQQYKVTDLCPSVRCHVTGALFVTACCNLGRLLGVLVISMSASGTITMSALCLDRPEPLRSMGDFNQVGFLLGVYLHLACEKTSERQPCMADHRM